MSDQNVGKSVLNQSVSERCQRQSVRKNLEAKDQGQVRLQKARIVHLLHKSLLNVYNMPGIIPGVGDTEVNKGMSVNGCSGGMLTWCSTLRVLLMHLLSPLASLSLHTG